MEMTYSKKMDIRIYPYHEGSMSARDLCKELGVKRIKHNNSTFPGGEKYTILNWGAGELKVPTNGSRILNNPKIVNTCANKLSFFKAMKKAKNGPRIPPWTTDIKEAVSWIGKGITVVARTVLTGHSGKGIVFNDDIDKFVKAPLYVQYIKKMEEYRIHFAFNEVIDCQKKVLRKEDEEGKPIDPKTVDWRIRNHSNGFIFIREGIRPHEDVILQAEKAYKSSGLDFGAVDVIFNNHESKAYVLEINTAPGLEGQTIESYANAFRKHL